MSLWTAATKGRRATWLVGAIWIATVIAGLASEVAASGPELSPAAGPLRDWLVPWAAISILFASVGAIIVARRPGNRVGLLMVVTGPLLVMTFGGFVVSAIREEAAGANDAAAALLAWVASLSIAPAVTAALPLLAVIFPDGRLPSPRWRRPVALLVLATLVGDILIAFQPGPLQPGLPDNPFGITGIPVLSELSRVSNALFLVVTVGGVILAAASIVIRFRRSSGAEREQMKWFLVSIVALAILMPLSIADGSPTASIFDIAVTIAIAFIPVSIGIAVTRYHLYDIDTVINRAIVYGLLTAILAGGSAAMISIFQRTFSGLIGGGSDTAVILTTLLVVAAFNPLKVRLQSLVDRRFKESSDPASRLSGLASELERGLWTPDPERTVEAVLRLAIDGFRAAGGTIQLRTRGDERQSLARGDLEGQIIELGAVSPQASLELRIAGATRHSTDADELAGIHQALGRTLDQLVGSRPTARNTSLASPVPKREGTAELDLGEPA